MLYRSYKPAPPLGAFVHDFWLYDGYAQPHLKERILPSGTIELVINLRDDELRDATLGAAGSERGYFDQSHLIRDFLSFSGLSPADYLLQQNCLRQRNVNLKRNHVPLAA